MPRFPTLLSIVLACLIAQESVAELPEPAPFYSQSKAMREDATLRAVSFANEQIGLACGERGTILRTDDGGQTWSLQKTRVDCQLSDVTWIDANRAIVVGGNYDKITKLSRGIALVTSDAGLTWQRSTDKELPWLRLVQQRSDMSLVAIGDWSHSLLTNSLESHNNGHTWQGTLEQTLSAREELPSLAAERGSAELRHWVTAIGTAAPIQDVCRMGPEAFCGVGEHGVISISGDNGKTWQVTRGKGRQCAVLVVADSVRTVPWAMVGGESLEHGTRVSVLLRDDSMSIQDRAIANQVGVMLGASSVRYLNAKTDFASTASDWLAIHRPASVVLDESLPTEIQEAFLGVASGMGVARIATSALDGSGRTTIHRDAMLPKTGVLASDMVLDASQYVAPEQAEATSVSLRYVYDIASEQRRDESVTSGLALSQGQMIQAKLVTASRRQIQMSQARMSRAQQFEKLVSSNPSQFASSFASLLNQTAKPDQFRTAWTLLQSVSSDPATRSLRGPVLQEIGSRFSELSASRWAVLQLQASQGSVEYRRLESISGMQELRVTKGTGSVPVSPFQVSPAESIASQFSPSQYSASSNASDANRSGVQQVSAVAPLLVPKPENIGVTKEVEKADPEVDLVWEFHPMVLIAREAFRNRGEDGKLQIAEAESANLKRLALGGQSEWASLLRRNGPRVVLARHANSRPRLDGKLDDQCWQSALRSAGQSRSLKVAYDDEYLYVAITLKSDHLGIDSMASQNPTQTRDHDLTSVDRVCLSLDTDGDLMTSMQLQVSDAGRTADSIDGNPAWQPTWYVDTIRTDNQVSIELAILRRDLVELPISVGESWYLSSKVLGAGESQQEQVIPDPKQWTRVIFQR